MGNDPDMYYVPKSFDLMAKEIFVIVTGREPEEFTDSVKDIKEYLEKNTVKNHTLYYV